MRSILPVSFPVLSVRRMLVLLAFHTAFAVSAQNINPADKKALDELLSSGPLRAAHVGLLFYDDSLKKDLALWQDDKFFTPASNTKLFSLYAGMKYLGDSLVGVRYFSNDTAVFVF